MTPQAVVFDFDGVLADTERLHFLAFRDVLASRGWSLTEPDYYARYLGFDDAGLIAEFARDRNVQLAPGEQVELVRLKSDRFQEHFAAGSVLFPGASEAVRRLASRFRLGIASGALNHEIHTVLSVTNLRDAFSVVVGAEDVRRTKPAPDPYLAATRQLDVSPSSAVAIEDSRWGLESARSAGLRTIAVTTSYPSSALTLADVIVDSLDKVTIDLVSGLLDRVA